MHGDEGQSTPLHRPVAAVEARNEVGGGGGGGRKGARWCRRGWKCHKPTEEVIDISKSV
jgi:hypothetical protein